MQYRLRPTLALLFLGLLACGDDPPASETVSEEPGPVGAAPSADEGPERAEPAPQGPPKRIFTKRFVANVRIAPDEAAARIGYLRGGAVLMARTAEPVGDAGCRGGWYELETGGFVCHGRDVVAFYGERLPEVRAAQPELEAKLPYGYAYSRKDRVPVYRNLPSDEEAAQYEGYRIPGQEPPATDEGEGTPPAEPDDEGPASAEGGAGAAGAAAVAEAPAEAAVDAGPPTLDSLMAGRNEAGERTILLRWMMKGFYVSLDRDFRVRRRRYWRTQQNEYIPYHMLGMAGGSDFAGVVLGEDDPVLLPAWVTSRRTSSYRLREDGRLLRGDAPGYHHAFRVVETRAVRDREYLIGDDDRAYRVGDVRQISPRPRPEEVGPDEKWIDVDLERQTLVAYEGDRPVFATLVSTGRIRREGVPDLDHRTPTGTFRINAKHVATTMDGDNAFDGPYSIQDVPYVMYYEMGYALHMAFWHDAFGRPKSHGCVNLSPSDAKWIFRWSEPHVPEGWHGAYASEERPGTSIHIRGETPRG